MTCPKAMNEIELLRRLADEVLAPDELAVQRLRSRLHTHIEQRAHACRRRNWTLPWRQRTKPRIVRIAWGAVPTTVAALIATVLIDGSGRVTHTAPRRPTTTVRGWTAENASGASIASPAFAEAASMSTGGSSGSGGAAGSRRSSMGGESAARSTGSSPATSGGASSGLQARRQRAEQAEKLLAEKILAISRRSD